MKLCQSLNEKTSPPLYRSTTERQWPDASLSRAAHGKPDQRALRPKPRPARSYDPLPLGLLREWRLCPRSDKFGCAPGWNEDGL